MQVFKRAHAFPDEGQKVAESILNFFPGFQAFALPPPAVDSEVLRRINDNKSRVNPLFWRDLDVFKRLLRGILAPKRSFNEGELVTGEGTNIAYYFGKNQALYFNNVFY